MVVLMTNTTTLYDLKQLTKAYGNENPSVWILDDQTDKSENAIKPTCVFIDNDGDIIIQVNKKIL